MKFNDGKLFAVYILLVVVLAVNALPKTLETLPELEMQRPADGNVTVTRTKRGPIEPLTVSIIAGAISAASLGVAGAGIAGSAANPGCRDYGCHNGYCWAYCSIGNQWCYTTRSGTWKGDYVKCSRKEDCDGCWKCGGACTV